MWTPPSGVLGDLVAEAQSRASALLPSVADLKRAANTAQPVPSLSAALRGGNVAVIAEVKRSSPSRGIINSALDVEALTRAYEAGGAAAISVLTEPSRFSGSDSDLVQTRSATRLPILKKDFHVEPAQIIAARALGASAALVIVRAIPPNQLKELLDVARDVGLEILLEVRDSRELDRALRLDAQLIGVNNRNLETLEIDPETSERIIPLIPRNVIAVAESGVKTGPDVERVADAGADAVLVGSELSASQNPEAAVRALTGVTRTGGARKS